MSPVDRRLVERSLDALDDVFYVSDADARLVHWNQRLNDLMRMDDDELRGMCPEEFFRPENTERVRAAVAEAFETGETLAEAHGWTVELEEGELGGARFVFDTRPV